MLLITDWLAFNPSLHVLGLLAIVLLAIVPVAEGNAAKRWLVRMSGIAWALYALYAMLATAVHFLF